MRGVISRAFAVIGLSLAFGCGDSPVTPDQLVGTYEATTFALSGDITEDVLAVGGSLTMTFAADGTTSGSLFVPAASAAGDGQDFTANLAGTFSIRGGNGLNLLQDDFSLVGDLRWWIPSARQINGSAVSSGVWTTVFLSLQ